MPIRLLLFSFGVVTVSFLPSLPSLPLTLALISGLALLIIYRRAYWLVALLAGFGWGIFAGHQFLGQQLDEALTGQELRVSGVITDLPESNDQRLRFNLSIRSASIGEATIPKLHSFPTKIQLSWYNGYNKSDAVELPNIVVGQEWQFNVRLKRPRGFANPAGFDYHAWLLRQGVGATGYVVSSDENVQVQSGADGLGAREWINWQRQQLQQWILTHSNSTERGILIALLIGDSSYVEKEQWDRMQRTGTSHLIAISGLHVGFLALFGFYVGLIIGKLIQLVWHSCPALVIAWCMAIGCASFYSALAGFNIPTVRTLIMLSVFYGTCLRHRSARVGDIFCCALALVVIIDPLAAYDMGFWLSFGAVALLLFYFSGRYVVKSDGDYWRGFSASNIATGFIRSQWVMFIGLLIPLSLLVSSVSLVAPIANAVAIPLITFLVVPLVLTSAALQGVYPAFSDLLLNTAGLAMEWLKVILQAMLDAAGQLASIVIAFSPGVSLLIAFSCLLLLLPKGLVHRVIGWSGLVLGVWLGVISPVAQQPDLKISIMDVGQGTAVVVQVKDKTLVYDTGPRYTDSFDAGGAILAPYLFSQAIDKVDMLVVSHSDMDHAGGLNSFLEKVDAKRIVMGDIENTQVNLTASTSMENCHQQHVWQWHQVSFEFLPATITRRTNDNNRSCVLLISYANQSILLPGDIETRVENQLLAEQKLPDHLTLLLAAHHGSRTSSSARFVSSTTPEFVVYSAGHRSQHGHPHPLVRKRFQAVGSREFNTADSGALVFEWSDGKPVNIIEYRKAQHRYWFE